MLMLAAALRLCACASGTYLVNEGKLCAVHSEQFIHGECVRKSLAFYQSIHVA
jgi:hypothetical protein